MTGEERCAEVFGALRKAGVDCLVMGGHAVRFHGLGRNTIDYDLVVHTRHWEELEGRVRRPPIVTQGRDIQEGPSWRPSEFRRFVIGRLPDGREERLEFWKTNHLLAPFDDLYLRRSTGTYGGGEVAFLGLQDLIRSKETEREDDWRDIAFLEERADEAALARARQGECAETLARLRSRRGFESAQTDGLYADSAMGLRALSLEPHPLSIAYLLPFLKASASVPLGPTISSAVREVLCGPVREVPPASARHLALVEVVRRLYKRDAIAADRADKLRVLRGGST